MSALEISWNSSHYYPATKHIDRKHPFTQNRLNQIEKGYTKAKDRAHQEILYSATQEKKLD